MTGPKHLINEAGDRLGAKRLPEGLTGIAVFHALVVATATSPGDVVIGIETDRGLWLRRSSPPATRYTPSIR